MGRRWGHTATKFSSCDLARYLHIPRVRVKRYARELGILRWNRARTRYVLFNEAEAKLIITEKHKRSIRRK